jgi:O-antigen ligase
MITLRRMAMIPGTTKRLTRAVVPAYPVVIATGPPTGNNPLIDPALEFQRYSPLRILAFWFALATLFLRISAFHQALAFVLHVNLKLLYVFGIPAILGTVLCGGLPRAFRGKPTFFWTAFALWMFLTVPTAVWKGGTFQIAFDYVRSNLILDFMVAGLVIGWKDYLSLMRCLAWGAFGTLLVARMFQNPQYQERFGLEVGMISNPNDFAGHLLLFLPLLFWLVLTSKSFAVKLVSLVGIAYGIRLIIGTASRGGLVGLVMATLLLLWWGSARQRVAVMAFVPIAFLLVLVTVSHTALNRIVSFSADSQNASVEAMQSSESRKYLLGKSIEYTLKFPIFGLGIGNFPVYEGTHSLVIGGIHGSWHETHNTFTQVSSESGIPGLFIFVGGLVSTFAIFYSVFRKASRRPNCADIRSAMLCVMLGMSGFVVSICFLNFGYFFYQPLLGGMAVAVATATKEEFAIRDRANH